MVVHYPPLKIHGLLNNFAVGIRHGVIAGSSTNKFNFEPFLDTFNMFFTKESKNVCNLSFFEPFENLSRPQILPFPPFFLVEDASHPYETKPLPKLKLLSDSCGGSHAAKSIFSNSALCYSPRDPKTCRYVSFFEQIVFRSYMI